MSLWFTAGRNLSKYLKLRNLQRARLISSAKYAYGKGAGLYNKYNALSPTRKALITNVYRQARSRTATITNKRKMRPALIRAKRRSTYVPRLIRVAPISRYARRDIRILRKAKLCWFKRLENTQVNTDYFTQPNYVWQSGSNDTTFPTPAALKTIRTYYADNPWQFDVSKFIEKHSQELLQDPKQSQIDIQSIQFNFTFINYQPDVDMRVRILLLRHVRDEQAANIAQDSHSDKLPDYWQDPVDKHERHNFNTAFTETDFDVNFKDYSPPSKRWKVWMSKVVTVKSNPHSGLPLSLVAKTAGNEVFSAGVMHPAENDDTVRIQNNYGPNMTNPNGTVDANPQTYDMNVNRIRGYPGQNERKCLMNWIPKGGYRFQYLDFDTAISENGYPEENIKVPKDDIRLLVLPFEDTKDVSRKATPHELGYRFEATLKFKDLL